MTHKIYLTESQLNLVIENQILIESMFKGVKNFRDLIKQVKRLVLQGAFTTSLFLVICSYYNLTDEQKDTLQKVVDETTVEDVVEPDTKTTTKNDPWVLACDDVTATVYNAVPSQCNADCGRTASMFRLNLKKPYSHRIIAIERTMMNKYGLKMGDVVYLEGVGEYDGIWQVQDKMNKRFAGLDKIDLLVNGDVKYGLWNDVKLYTLKDKSRTDEFKNGLAPQLSNKAFNAQFTQI